MVIISRISIWQRPTVLWVKSKTRTVLFSQLRGSQTSPHDSASIIGLAFVTLAWLGEQQSSRSSRKVSDKLRNEVAGFDR